MTIRLFLSLLFVSNVIGADYYASKTGSASNPGTLASPWTLQAGITTNILTAGDTVWIRGGTYNFGSDFPLIGLNPTVPGSSSGQITFRSYTGERVIINGYFGIYKPYITVRDLEFTDLSTNWGRPTSTGRYPGDGVDPFEPALGVDYPRSGVWVEADYCKVINCLIYDCPIGTFSGGANEWHGNIFLGNSCVFTNEDSIGEGLYLHNGDSGLSGDGSTLYNGNDPAVVENNVFCYGYRAGLNEWGSQLGVVKNVHNTNNVVLYYDFNCRAQTTTVKDCDIINNVVAGNPLNFFTHPVYLNLGYGTGPVSNIVSSGNLIIGGGLGYRNVTNSVVSNNIICTPAGGGFGSVFWDVSDTNTVSMFSNHYFSNSSVFTNRFVRDGDGSGGFTAWTNLTKLDLTSLDTINADDPGTNIVRIIGNKYDSRVTVFVANFQLLDTVSLDLSGAQFPRGDFEVRFIQNYFGPKITGSYSGSPITLPMTNWAIAQPKYLRAARSAGINTDLVNADFEESTPRWGAFVLLPLGARGKVGVLRAGQIRGK